MSYFIIRHDKQNSPENIQCIPVEVHALSKKKLAISLTYTSLTQCTCF